MATKPVKPSATRPARVGKASLTVWMDPQAIKMAKIGALMTDVTIEVFVEQALRDAAAKAGVKL